MKSLLYPLLYPLLLAVLLVCAFKFSFFVSVLKLAMSCRFFFSLCHQNLCLYIVHLLLPGQDDRFHHSRFVNVGASSKMCQRNIDPTPHTRTLEIVPRLKTSKHRKVLVSFINNFEVFSDI